MTHCFALNSRYLAKTCCDRVRKIDTPARGYMLRYKHDEIPSHATEVGVARALAVPLGEEMHGTFLELRAGLERADQLVGQEAAGPEVPAAVRENDLLHARRCSVRLRPPEGIVETGQRKRRRLIQDVAAISLIQLAGLRRPDNNAEDRHLEAGVGIPPRARL